MKLICLIMFVSIFFLTVKASTEPSVPSANSTSHSTNTTTEVEVPDVSTTICKKGPGGDIICK